MQQIADFLNGILWSTPLPILCLGAGLFFTFCLRGIQVRKVKEMVKLLFSGQASERGMSSFQAFTLAIAGRVGTGNIAGVATAIAMGGPGALFWMWMVAIFGAATSFVECTMAQLYKEEIDGEYRGGTAFYIARGLNIKFLGTFYAVVILIAEAVCLTGIQSNAISAAMENAFSIPKLASGIVIFILLGIIIFGGAKRLGRAAEIIVPFMAVIYCIVAILVIILNISKLPAVIVLIFSSAFGANAIFGGLLGSAVMWGVKRGVYSNEAGMGTATQSAAAAEVSHPAKQGLVQSFSVYIDTLFVCTATGFMMLMTDCYNVFGADGNMIVENLGGVEAGPVWVQTAINTIVPFGAQFVAIALFFFAFTTLMNMYYNCETNLAYFFKDGFPKSAQNVLRVIYLIFTFIGAVITADAVWAFGDVGTGSITWINVVCLLFLIKPAMALLKDYEEQKKQGLDPVFDPDKFEYKNTSLWKNVRDGFKKGNLKN